LEVGAIIRRLNERGGPAPLFLKIKDYPEGYKILGSPHGHAKPYLYARASIALGLPRDTSTETLVNDIMERLNRRVKPITVGEGPCKENIHVGDEADVTEFPAPIVHGGDGGRYISTWCATVTKDLDSDWVNWGMYRQAIPWKGYTLNYEETTKDLPPGRILLSLIVPTGHGGMMLAKYRAKGMAMPCATFMGGPPVAAIAAAAPLPAGVSEAEVAGGLGGKPIELIKCETQDLEVPATSEIVIEGEIPKDEKVEGPFGEYTGHRGMPPGPRPWMKVTAVTHREEPILPVSCMGKPIDEWCIMGSLFGSALLTDFLKKQGFPIRLAYYPPPGVGNHLLVVSTKVPYYGYTQALASAIWGHRFGMLGANVLIVVDEDVDPTNLNEVLWAVSTRCMPSRGIHVEERAFTYYLWPAMSPLDRPKGMGSKVLIDATWPKDWPPEWIPPTMSFDKAYPEHIRKKVLENWRAYGFKD
jgi:4-hydroxy-3-polyprenylbenzoate decarboxylase